MAPPEEGDVECTLKRSMGVLMNAVGTISFVLRCFSYSKLHPDGRFYEVSGAALVML